MLLGSRHVGAGTGDGGVPARRAVIRWAWRLCRREWRQQILVLAMLTVAVAAMILGAGGGWLLGGREQPTIARQPLD